MILTNIEIGLSIEIDDKLISNLIYVGKKHYPNEFGGFLIGNYSDDLKKLNITNTILPNRYKATQFLFERENIGIKEQLEQFYKENPQKFYIGEWHTHPNNLPIPSNTDIIAMNNIANSKEVAIQSPVFLIIGYNKIKTELGFYIIFKNKIYRYETVKE